MICCLSFRLQAASASPRLPLAAFALVGQTPALLPGRHLRRSPDWLRLGGATQQRGESLARVLSVALLTAEALCNDYNLPLARQASASEAGGALLGLRQER